MSAAERRKRLGDAVVAHIHDSVDEAVRDFMNAPAEDRADLIRRLRPILAPAAARLQARRAAEASAADAA